MRTRYTSRFSSAVLPLVLIFSTAPISAGTEIKLASVPPEYTPTAGSGFPEPIFVDRFSFEVAKETGRARIIVEYTYPDEPIFSGDGGTGPEPTIVQVPGLTYNATEATIVYDNGSHQTVCARIQEHRSLFWHRSRVMPTGACVVTSRVVNHAVDDGWKVRRFRTIDTFFEVR